MKGQFEGLRAFYFLRHLHCRDAVYAAVQRILVGIPLLPLLYLPASMTMWGHSIDAGERTATLCTCFVEAEMLFVLFVSFL